MDSVLSTRGWACLPPYNPSGLLRNAPQWTVPSFDSWERAKAPGMIDAVAYPACVWGDFGNSFALEVQVVRAVGEVAAQFHPEFIVGDEGAIRIDVVAGVGGVAAVLSVEPFNPYGPQEGMDRDSDAFTVAFWDPSDYVGRALGDFVVQPDALDHFLDAFVGELSEAFYSENKVRAREVQRGDPEGYRD